MTARMTPEALRSLIAATHVDTAWQWRATELLRRLTAAMADECERVLDIGKSSRANYGLFRSGQIVTADLNQYEGYPDILVDICDAETFPQERFDGVICHSVLEHVYEPFVAIANLHDALRPGGRFLGFVPFLMQYHAPPDLKFQDFYRFTRDGLAYAFRAFEDVTLYPVRGWGATAASVVIPLKRFQTRRNTEWLSRIVDTLLPRNPLQTTGYVITAVKPTVQVQE